MSVEGPRFYPGENATASEVLALADEYRVAAEALRPLGRRGMPLSWAPYRLVAIQAIELYLNALLLHGGHSSSSLRGLHHNLAKRTHLAAGSTPALRQRTIRHLESLSQTREYLVTRYDPAQSAASQLNRLAATLSEVASKTSQVIKRETSLSGGVCCGAVVR